MENAITRYPRTILATCCVPWDERGRLLEDVFRRSIRTLRGHGLTDLYVFGTAGEGHAVTDAQFNEIVAVFVDEVPAPDERPMVGIISPSLPTVIERIERCRERGVDLFQLSLPSWGTLNDRELRAFFAETCGRFPEARFLHYNLPRAGRVVTPAEYAALAAAHPNLVATKNAGAAYGTAIALLDGVPELRHFFTEPGFAYASLFGEAGFLVSVASLNPRAAREFYEAGVRRDAAMLGDLGRELAAIIVELGRLAGTAHMDGAFDKCLVKVHEPDFPLRLLPPYETMPDQGFDELLRVLEARFPRWLPDARA